MVGSGAIETIALTISIDTECDHDPRWHRSDPLRFDSIHRGLPERLQPAFMALGAVPTYLLTVEVLEDDACVDTLRCLPGAYEYGTHLHAAFIEPDKKFYDYAGVDSPDFQSSYPPDIEYQKLHNLTRLFSTRLGYQPTSFRAGRYGAGPATIDALQRLGYRVDTSVTPYQRWVEPNGSVDFRRAPEQPYFPLAGSIATAGLATEGRLLEVPVSVKRRRFRRTPLWFRPWFATVNQMKSVFQHHVEQYRNERVVTINMMFHSMEVIEKASPYPQTTDDVRRFIDDMQSALDWARDEGAVFRGLSELAELYRPAGSV